MPAFTHTRIAPTPSGYLHIGNALNFLLTHALAKRHGASILLRIDDMDRERLRPEYVDDIFEALEWLGIQWQQGPTDAETFERGWSQRRRMTLYDEALQTLWDEGCVFACTCSRQQTEAGRRCDCRNKALPPDTPSASWRVATGDAAPLEVLLLTGEKQPASLPPEVRNFIVRRKDGLPAYQLTSLVDDVHFGIDFIVRGQDLWASTLAQLYLSRLLHITSFQRVAFAHHPLLTDDGGTKLSKSAGASSLKQWRAEKRTKGELLACIGQRARAPQPVKNGDGLLKLLGLAK